MTLFFDLKKLELESISDPERFIALLSYHYFGRIPPAFKSRFKVPKTTLKGKSFILNPEPILSESLIHISYKVQYIKLAGRRDYFLYKLYGLKSLDRSYFPDLNIESIQQNPLLIIEPTQIKFKYEEITHGSKIRRN